MGVTYICSMNFKTCDFTRIDWGGSHVAGSILLLYLLCSFVFSLSLSQFQPIFGLFVTILLSYMSLFQGHVACHKFTL